MNLFPLNLGQDVDNKILDMKYQMEHSQKMQKICNTIKDMTCIVLNTVYEDELRPTPRPTTSTHLPMQTHVIFHDRITADIKVEESIELYVFAFEPHEIEQYFYIAQVIGEKGDIFLNKQEYEGLYNINKN